MSILQDLDLDRLGPARLWAALDPELRESAARSMYRSDDEERRMEADVALAEQLRFRPASIRKLPVAKRVAYLTRQVRPDDNLAASLLMALHLVERRALLAAFLDNLGIPHENGTIDEDHDLDPPDAHALGRAADGLFESFDKAEVEVYLVSLLALDPETWNGLSGYLRKRVIVDGNGRTDTD